MTVEDARRFNEAMARVGDELARAAAQMVPAFEALDRAWGDALRSIEVKPQPWYRRWLYAVEDFLAREWTPQGFGRE